MPAASAVPASSGGKAPCRCLRLASIGALLLFSGLVLRYWHPVYGFTAFLQLDHSYDATKIAAFRNQPVYVYPFPGHYDGIAYSQIAYHPLLNAPELRVAVDSLSYRARRILAPALAWALAAGQPALIVQVYCALNLAAWLALAALLWRLLPVEDWRGGIAWAGVLFSAGALSSVREALTDLIALAILAAGIRALERGRPGRALGWLATAALTRETSLAALSGLWTRPWCSRTNLRRTALAVLPLAVWLVYLRWRVGPADPGVGNFAWPAIGFIGKWRATAAALAQGDAPLRAWATLLAMLSLAIRAAFILFRPRADDPWWRIGAAYVALMLILGPAVWTGLPGAAPRVLLPLTLAFNVLAVRVRASAGWLVAGNLGMLAGLLALGDQPFDGRELLAARHGGEACVIRVGDGWYGCEHNRHHLWAWSGGDGRLEIEAWPRPARTLELEFLVESIAPRTVAIRENGRELWQGKVGRPGVLVKIPIQTAAGLAQVAFTTDAPAVRENGRPDARRLAFEIYDPRLLTDP